MVLLFLVVFVLLIWVIRLASRVTELESRDAESQAALRALRTRLDALSGTATPPQPAQPVPPLPRPTPTPAAAPQPQPAQAAAPPLPPPVRAEAAAPPVPLLTPTPPPATSSAQPAADSRQPTAGSRPPQAESRPAAAVRAPAERLSKGIDWEELIGVRLFSWVAGIALAAAAVFFLGYSIQQGWLQPPVRMAIGLAVGVGLLVACELKAARRYPVTANALDGAAIVILFSTFFATYRLWQLIGPLTAFGLLGLVTVVAVLLSIRRDSVFIALLGLVGGFATPALLSTGQDNPFGLFGYLLMLNAGLGWIAYRKRWPVLVALSLVSTTIYQWGWVATFLTPGKMPTALAIFLAFPILGFVSLGLAGRAGALDSGGAERRAWFENATALNAALPLLFALFMAASRGYGDYPALLFGFLFFVDAGLFAVALWRGEHVLHVLGAAATLVVFAAWASVNYQGTMDAWGGHTWTLVAFASLFVAFYLAAGLAGRHGRRRLEGAGRLAVYAAPLLLFLFPTLAATEPGAAPALPFVILFALLSACAVFAVLEDEGTVYFIAAFLAVAAEAAWSANHLDADRLLPGLIVYAAFALLFLGVPLAARRWRRPLQPAWLGSFLLVVSIGLLFFLSSETAAPHSLWGLAILLALLNAALAVDGRASRARILPLAGSLLSWFVLAAWWLNGTLTAHIVPAMVVLAGLAGVMLAGQLWMRAGTGELSSDATQVSLGPALVGHVFLMFVAVQPSLSLPPWPMLAVLAVLDVAIAAAALYTTRAEVLGIALAASQLILIAWGASAGTAPWPLVAMLSSGVVAALGLAGSWLAERRLAGQPLRLRFHAAAAASLMFGEVLLAVLGTLPDAPGAAAFAAFHAAFLVSLLALATFAGWFELSVVAALLAWVATFLWHAMRPAEGWPSLLLLASIVYAVFLAYPLVLDRRLGRRFSPHLAAVVASAAFFQVGRLAVIDAGYESVIGLLPVVQAGLMGILLARLIQLEPPSDRTLGRLAMVAGTALALLTVAIPLQLEKEWLTIGWALEGAALAWLYRRIPHRGLFWWSLALLAFVFVRLTLNPEVLVYQPRSETRIFNWYLYTYLTCAASALVSGWLYSKADDRWAGTLRGSQVAPAMGTVLLFVLLNVEIADFFATGSTITFNLSAGLAQNLTYTLGWGMFAVCLLAAGIVLRSHAARVAAIILLTVTVLKGFLSDVARLGGLYRVMSFVGLAVCLSLVAMALQRFVLSPRREERDR